MMWIERQNVREGMPERDEAGEIAGEDIELMAQGTGTKIELKGMRCCKKGQGLNDLDGSER
jgi:hypothetical protein